MAQVLPGATPDIEVLRYAVANAMILVTKDDDFALRFTHPELRVVWLRIGNATNRALIEWLEPRWERVENALDDGEHLIEVV
ncbi:conserved hypothetical protein [Erythrobacter sp. EC-HK427]|nr:conserved hypothetical protein [Erythrobacter sp. EC-HK427]